MLSFSAGTILNKEHHIRFVPTNSGQKAIGLFQIVFHALTNATKSGKPRTSVFTMKCRSNLENLDHTYYLSEKRKLVSGLSLYFSTFCQHFVHFRTEFLSFYETM